MDAIRLDSYSKALAEEFKNDVDTLLVLDKMVRSRRPEYEAKIPDMGDLLQRVRERRSERREAERAEDEKLKSEAYMRDVREHPENYVTMGSIWKSYEARQAAEAK